MAQRTDVAASAHTVPPRPHADARDGLGCTDRSRVLGAVADVLDLVGEAVTATTICVGAALGAALPPTRRVHVDPAGSARPTTTRTDRGRPAEVTPRGRDSGRR